MPWIHAHPPKLGHEQGIFDLPIAFDPLTYGMPQRKLRRSIQEIANSTSGRSGWIGCSILGRSREPRDHATLPRELSLLDLENAVDRIAADG